jgi:quinolinate synthase
MEELRKLMKELEEVDKRIAVPVNPEAVAEAKVIINKMLELCEA